MSKCNENIFTCSVDKQDTLIYTHTYYTWHETATSNIPQCHPKGIFINLMLMPLQPTAATTATATAIPTAAAVTLPHLPIVFMAISCVVCCVCGLLEAASSCGSIKIFVASFSSSSLNSSRCKFLAVFVSLRDRLFVLLLSLLLLQIVRIFQEGGQIASSRRCSSLCA